MTDKQTNESDEGLTLDEELTLIMVIGTYVAVFIALTVILN